MIAALILDQLTIRRDRTISFFLLHAFVLGMGSYVLLGALLWLFALIGQVAALSPSEISFFEALVRPEVSISWAEVAGASFVAVGLSAALAAASTHKLLHRVARRLRLSRRSGEMNVWGFTLNSPDVNWVVVRDLKFDLMFEGWVQSFSEDCATPELLMREVRVYRNSTSELLYEVGGMYFHRNHHDLMIDIANLGYERQDYVEGQEAAT